MVGDVMYDACLRFGRLAAAQSSILRTLALEPQAYCLATLHRAYNVDAPERLARIIHALGRVGASVVLPQHPRLARRLREHSSRCRRTCSSSIRSATSTW